MSLFFNELQLIYVNSLDMHIDHISTQLEHATSSSNINTQSAHARPNSQIYTKASKF
jgi:hypothetical protein